MLSFRLQCPKCKLKCVTYPDDIVYMITENHNPRLMFGEQVLESEVESVRVHCYFCKFEWWLGKEDTKTFMEGIDLKNNKQAETLVT